MHAKGDPIASLQRALRTGRCELRPESYATELVLDSSGRRATGVRYLDLTGYPDPPRREVRAARAVVLAAGAFETPRLLLRNGLGGDLVGRFLTYHFQTFTVGIFPDDTGGERGRSVTHLHDDLMIDTPELRAAAKAAGLPWLRGGVVEHGAGPGPVDESATYPTGAAHLTSMADSALRRRLWVFTMQGEDLPQATNRIDLDPAVRDAWGLAAGRVTYAPHRHELVASTHASPLHEAVLRDAGAEARVLGHVAAPGRPRPARRGQPARHRARQPPRHGHGPHGHRPGHARWCRPSSGSGTSTTCSSATRRCSSPPPATTPPSRWPPSPTAPPSLLAGT